MPELTLVDATGENGLRLCLEYTGILLWHREWCREYHALSHDERR